MRVRVGVGVRAGVKGEDVDGEGACEGGGKLSASRQV